MIPERPLDRVASIKVKLGLLVAASILVATFVAWIGDRAEVPGWISLPVTLAVALLVTQWLARGMVAPLREMTGAAARMADGDYDAVVTATSRDEVGQLARAFTRMAGDLATVDEQRRQLVATVSHELRTPLAAQRAVLENLVDGVVRPDDASLGSALAQAERLSDLVEDLLDLSRIDGGAAQLRLEEVSVAETLARCVAEAELIDRDVRIEVAVTPEDLRVRADPARLGQVVANLLDNATRHSPHGGHIRLTAAHESGADWTLEVADEGSGIPLEQRERVFERFGTHTGGGTGIGLAIARWVCELHGGSIRVEEPRPGMPGARLLVTLPVAPSSPVTSSLSPAPPAPVPSPVPPSPSPSSPSPARPLPPSGRRPEPTTPVEATMTSQPAPLRQQPLNPYSRQVAPGPPLMDQIFGPAWPERDSSPQPGLLLGSVLVGLLAAVVLPYRNVGVGVLLVLLAAGGLVLFAAARRAHRWTLLSAVLCLGLASTTVLRQNEATVFLAVATAGALVATALTGAWSLPAMVASGAAWVLSGLRGLPLLGRTLTAVSRRPRLWAAARTGVIALVLLVVFGALLSSADAVFGSWASALVPDLNWDSLTFRGFVWFLVGGVTLAGCYLAINPPRADRIALPPGRPVAQAWEWLVPVGVVVALLLGFVVAQAAAMFGGHDYVQRTTGLTYAAYVHQGFAQLTVTTALTLVVVALAGRKASRVTGRDRLLLRAGLGALCALALVVVVSALSRMNAYQEAYGFTTLRLYVDAFEVWLGLLLVFVLMAGVRLRARWVPRAALLAGATIVLGLSLANPDGVVASQNTARYHRTGTVDASYLASMGPDAAATVASSDLPSDLRQCVVWGQATLPASGVDDWLGWNLGTANAKAAVASLGGQPDPATCAAFFASDYSRQGP